MFVCVIGFMMKDKILKKEESVLIPRSVLFGNPDKIGAQISNDAQFISYVAPYNGVLNVYVAPIDHPESAKVITNDIKRGIDSYFWCYDNKHIVYLQDTDGDENWHIHVVNVLDGITRNLTNFPGVRAAIQNVSRHSPNKILIKLNKRRKDLFDIYELDLTSGEMQIIYENEEFISILSDSQFNLRFGSKMLADGRVQIYQFGSNMQVTEFMEIPADDVYTTDVIGLDDSGKILYLIDSRNRNTAALFSIDLETDTKQLIYENNKVDVSGILPDTKTRVVQAVSYNYLKNEWFFIDDAIKADFEHIKSNISGEISISSRSLDDDVWILYNISDDTPVSYYKYDRKSKKLEFLFYHRKALAALSLNKLTPVVIKARDGLELVSYLTLPNNIPSKEEAVKTLDPAPMVLLVHGGPNARDSWGYNGLHQWLANRGYAVLSVNYRGSTGFGKAFIKAGDGEWAGKMHDDLIDAVNWAISNGITTKDKVAIMGGSYGGYAALVGLTFTPDVFACGVDIVGPSNLLTLANTIPEYWKPSLAAIIRNIGGDPATEEGRAILASKSPLTFIDRISKPLLIGQGANDPRVKQAESDQIVEAMAANDIPVTYVLYQDEGHGFARPQNRLSFYAITEGFLSTCLGGKVEPVGKDFYNASLKIKHGKEFLPKDVVQSLSAE